MIDPDYFFESDIVKLITLGAVGLLLMAMPFFLRATERKLPAGVAPLYRKLSTDSYIQTVFMLAPIGLAIYNGMRGNNLGYAVTLSFLSICAFGGLASLWNVRKAWVEIRIALPASTNQSRIQKLSQVEEMAKAMMVVSLISMLMGVAGFVYVYSVEKPVGWFWFAAFLMTMQPIQSRTWSVSVLAVASKYAADPKFGEEAPTEHMASSPP